MVATASGLFVFPSHLEKRTNNLVFSQFDVAPSPWLSADISALHIRNGKEYLAQLDWFAHE